MTAIDMLQCLHGEGVALRLDGPNIRYAAPAGAFTRELAAARARKPELLQALRDPQETAYRLWESAVHAVARRWNERFAGSPDAPWLDDGDDLALQEEIAAAVRAGDLQRTLELVAEWQRRWEEILDLAHTSDDSPTCCTQCEKSTP